MCKGSLPPDPRAALERLRDDYRTKWQKHQEQRKSATDHFHMGYEEGEEYAYRTAASDLTAILDAWPQGEPMMPVRVVDEVLVELWDVTKTKDPTAAWNQGWRQCRNWIQDHLSAALAPHRAAADPCPTCGGMKSVPFGMGIPQGEDEYDACPDCAKSDQPQMCAKCGKHPTEQGFTICEFCMGIEPDPPPLTTEQRARWYLAERLGKGIETTARYLAIVLAGDRDNEIRAWLAEGGERDD